MHHSRTRLRIGLSVLVVIATTAFAQKPPNDTQQGRDQKVQSEEREDYYQKWLEVDVAYVIQPQERDVFLKLSTAEEKDNFIEQFWLRRDSDPRTSANEWKEEHYRRIAYANEHFYSGEPGWKTDRGEMYIKFGPPDSRETYPNGGPYARRLSEGGGRTSVYPFERWRYNFIEGVGNNIEIEFVDPSRTGEYRIALSPQDKDELLYVNTNWAGKTEGEELGLENRWLRITRDYGLGIQSRSGHYAIHPDDFPFERLQRFSQLQRAPEGIEHRRLRADVNTLVSFEQLPFRATVSQIRMGPGVFLVPITVQVENLNLNYVSDDHGQYAARLEIYGLITGLGGRIFHEFDHTLVNRAESSELIQEGQRISLFQKTAILRAGRYKVDIYLKDAAANRIGVYQEAVHLEPAGEEMELSPLVLADLVELQSTGSESFDQFQLGSHKVVPNVEGQFSPQDVVHLYLQAYNVQLDQATLEPDLMIRYFLMREGRVVEAFPDTEGRSIAYVSPQRVVLTTAFRLEKFEPGRYRALVRLQDRVSGIQAERETTFRVVEPIRQ